MKLKTTVSSRFSDAVMSAAVTTRVNSRTRGPQERVRGKRLALLLATLLLAGTALEAGPITWTVTTTASDPQISFSGTINTGAYVVPEGVLWGGQAYGMMGYFTFSVRCTGHTSSVCRTDIPSQAQFYDFSYANGIHEYYCDLNYTRCSSYDHPNIGDFNISFASSLLVNTGPIQFTAHISDYNGGYNHPATDVSGYVTPDFVISAAPEPSTSAMAATAALLALGRWRTRAGRKRKS